MAGLITEHRPMDITPKSDYFGPLTRSIISQQVSVTAARTIFNRLVEGTLLNPQKIDDMEMEELKKFGLSRQKAGYIKDLAAHFVIDPDVFNHLEELEDEIVIKDLTTVKGIGPWTAQMFLMFTLARLDVFAPADLGLQKAIRTNYSEQKMNKPIEFEEFAERWRPYRTVA
ncbi:MAG: hypothetical protein R3313_04970, partial [Candidatus Saccharimonadales bacterium]|nr:hypothetical protein [Candidatus Saccharimonadales bacterium]